jgi:hypothetical protein
MRLASAPGYRNGGVSTTTAAIRVLPFPLFIVVLNCREAQDTGKETEAMQQDVKARETARDETIDLATLVADLNALLRLKTTVIGMKMFGTVAEMEAIPKIRRPSAIHTTDQIVSMASRLGWTVGITSADLVGAQCRAVIGLAPTDEKWMAGEAYVGVWHGTQEDAQKRQEALCTVPYGR